MWDAIFVGSGINSLVGAALLAKSGWKVCVLERNAWLGGAIHSAEITEPGFVHDVFSAWHPLFAGSEAFALLKKDLTARGLEYLNTEYPTAGLLPDGAAAFLSTSQAANVQEFDRLAPGDGKAWAQTADEFPVVVGAGNIYRGLQGAATGMDRATADYMGMLATLMNALALQDALRRAGVESRVQSALRIDQVAEPYIRGRALRHLELNRVVIFAAGTGNPFFTTDTAAALRGREMSVDIVLKATKVDGVYTSDPHLDKAARRYQSLTFDEAIARHLKVMDATALALCRDQNMQLKVFSIFVPGALKRVVMGEDEGTLVHC